MTKEQQILNLIDDDDFFEEVIKTALNASSSVHYGYALLDPETLKLQGGWLQRNEIWPAQDEIELLVIEPYDDEGDPTEPLSYPNYEDFFRFFEDDYVQFSTDSEKEKKHIKIKEVVKSFIDDELSENEAAEKLEKIDEQAYNAIYDSVRTGCIEDIVNRYNNDEIREEMKNTVRDFFA